MKYFSFITKVLLNFFYTFVQQKQEIATVYKNFKQQDLTCFYDY